MKKYTPYENEMNMEGIEYPVAIMDIDKFEKQNDISINVLGYEDKKLFPLHITETREKQHHVDLLLINKDNNSHYILIKDFSRLVRAQYSKGITSPSLLSLLFSWMHISRYL